MYKFRYYKGVRFVAAKNPAPAHFTTCGTCQRKWDDTKSTALTPVPGARCPFEYFRRHNKDA